MNIFRLNLFLENKPFSDKIEKYDEKI